MTRVKIPEIKIETREQMERLVGEICDLTIFRDYEVVQMDQKLAAVRREYEQKIGLAEKSIDEKLALARTWAENNKDQFGAKKSIEMTHGVIGFRTGMPKLKLLSKWTWEKVKAALLNGRLNGYTRTEVSVDKEALLADREKMKDKMATVGVRVDQEESFFVDPKREEMNPARLAG